MNGPQVTLTGKAITKFNGQGTADVEKWYETCFQVTAKHRSDYSVSRKQHMNFQLMQYNNTQCQRNHCPLRVNPCKSRCCPCEGKTQITLNPNCAWKFRPFIQHKGFCYTIQIGLRKNGKPHLRTTFNLLCTCSRTFHCAQDQEETALKVVKKIENILFRKI